MNNLDFSAEPLFSWYVVLLALSGLIMLVLGVLPLGGLKVGLRIFNVLFGLGFLGYAYYLAFVFEGGEYFLFFKAFILPVGMIVASVKAIVDRSNAKNRPTPPVGPYNPNAPYGPNAAQQGAFNPYAQQPGQPVPPQGAAPYQPGVPTQPVTDNPYAQPGQPQPPQQPAG
ncbi:hypothetical protein [Kitasatospora cathayae]|uniref:Uncharacterized protein n=1 Tax=Kitasatospora cathayae TaxID=3004092 RepID=A0ABY7Q875_9ACTN|nr:hypothetical protein [Kitasatospora sp. HUAS 3-15]WBP88506.1 hypothetical protein O1G21_23455 [Kitasatospora sp. HUAS 3-15]